VPPQVHPQVAAIGPTQFRKTLSERGEASLIPWIAFARHKHADPPYAVALLRARRERPSGRAPEEGDELAPIHSITLVANA
jgi:hypothetical protein